MRSTRFQPAPLDHALIDLRNSPSDFQASAVGIILNESYTGCALVFKTTETLQHNQVIQVQVGRLGVMPAKVVWVKALDENLIKVGLQFLE